MDPWIDQMNNAAGNRNSMLDPEAARAGVARRNAALIAAMAIKVGCGTQIMSCTS